MDLCSESTGNANLAVVSVGTIGEATDDMKVCSLPVTPCMELPGEPSISAIDIAVFSNERGVNRKVIGLNVMNIIVKNEEGVCCIYSMLKR